MTTADTEPAAGVPPGARGLDAPAPDAPDIDLPSTAIWLQQLFRHNTRAIAIADWEGRFELGNDAYQALLGYTEDELGQMELASVIHPDDRAENLALVDRLRAGELSTFEIETRLLRRDGSAVWVQKFVSVLPDRTGAPAHIIAMITDVDDRKRFEQQTLERAKLLDLSSDAIIVRGADDRIEYWNRGAERLYGYAREDALGCVSHELLKTEFPDSRDAIREELLHTGFWSGELAHTRADGMRIVTLSRWQVADTNGGPRVMETDTDITQRTLMEAELRASEERFRATFDHAPVGVAHVALDGRFLLVNDAFATISRRSREELGRSTFHEITHPDDLQSDLELAQRLLAGELPSYSLEKRYIAPDGEAVWINLTGSVVRDANGEPDYFVAVIEDINERREAAERLARAAATEHGISLRLQQALLPEHLARADTLDVAAKYSAVGEHLEVGGDWYDAIALPDGRICFVVGDVVGHGLDAAAVMGRLRAGLAALAARERTPGELLTALDQFARSAHGTDFATIGCAFVDPGSGAVEYAFAGHPPMLVVDPSGAHRWLEGGRSAPLATAAVAARPTASTTLEPGSVLIAYSDGLVERRGRSLIDGLADLCDAAVASRDARVHELCNRLVGELSAKAPSEDDIVVLVVRYDPSASTTFRRVIPADGTALAPLRAALRAWLAEQSAETATVDEVLLATGEACANAIEHAYVRRERGTVEITVAAGDHRVLDLEIRDRGTWRGPDARTPERGRGTAVMQALASDFSRTTGPEGTVVRMCITRRDHDH